MIQTMKRSCTRRLPAAALYLASATLMTPTASPAEETLEHGSVGLNAMSIMQGARFDQQQLLPADARYDFDPPVLSGELSFLSGEFAQLETYVGTKVPSEWLPFDSSAQGVGDAFASASISTAATGGVGVSGLHETRTTNDRTKGNMVSLVTFQSSVKNVGTRIEAVDFKFHIPRIELTIVPERDDPTDDFFEAEASGWFAVEQFDEAGQSKYGQFALFDYRLDYDEALFGVEAIVISDDLLVDAGTSRATPNPECSTNYCTSVRFDEFDVVKTVNDLKPGETLVYSYTMTAAMWSFGPRFLDGSSGGLAFFGDPLEIGGRGSLEVGVGTQAPVPLPPTVVLLALGLATLGARLRLAPS